MKKLGILLAVLVRNLAVVESTCSTGCDVALASYYIQAGATLLGIAGYLDTSVDDIMSYNPQIPNENSIARDTRINVPFSCDCIDGDFLGHLFTYRIQSGDTYTTIAGTKYVNLTTATSIQSRNSYSPTNLRVGGNLSVPVNCSCGNSNVSTNYGLFITYPLRPSETLSSIAQQANLNRSLLQRYNPGANFNAGNGLVYIPGRDRNGNYPPLILDSRPGGSASTGISPAAIAGICVAVGLSVFLVVCLVYFRRKKKEEALFSYTSEFQTTQAGLCFLIPLPISNYLVNYDGPEDVTGQSEAVAVNPKHPGIAVDKSVEFSYEELANATGNFSLTNKIGQGGFGAVYYGELRGEQAAIKKMDMQATREFLAELKVRLIGYCVEGFSFPELSSHGMPEYKLLLIQQEVLNIYMSILYPVYIHRDIKSANILIDNKFHAKVADFGLTKLAEVGNASLPTRLVGTFGYMPPEDTIMSNHVRSIGDVSAKVDVFAFGVVLFELISGKEAVVKQNGSDLQPQGLATLFQDVLSQSDPKQHMQN
ncbi:Chitin elicitor receptor kinase 1 [Bienertia sinuspersici]